MKIAFLTDGKFPVPATRGGAVENLVENLLNMNEEKRHYEFSVFSIWDYCAEKKSQTYRYTKFEFVKCPKRVQKADKIIYWLAKTILKKSNLISYRYILQRLYIMSKYPRIMLKNDYDRIIVVTNSTLFLTLKKRRVARKYNGKVIYYLHNEVRSLFKCKEEIENIRSLIGISDFVNKSFRKMVPSLTDNQCYVLKNCVDVQHFSHKNEKRIYELKKKYKIKEEDYIVLFAGRLIKEKGALETIKAVKACNDESIKLLIVGAGFYSSDVIDDYTIELRKESETISDKIIFTGYVDYDDMPSIYHLSDIAVLPSIWDEPAGMTMIEAVVSGTPLITTNSGGIPEYIASNAAVILERNENLISNIKENILKIKNNKEIKNKLISNSIMLRSQLNLDNYYSRFSEIIDNG